MYYTIAKSDFDKIVFNTFGIDNYEVKDVDSSRDTGIIKIDDNTYQVRTKATGWYAPSSELNNFEIDSTNAVVEYNLLGSAYDNTEGQIVGKIKFYLTKNGENWNLIKIEYDK